LKRIIQDENSNEKNRGGGREKEPWEGPDRKTSSDAKPIIFKGGEPDIAKRGRGMEDQEAVGVLQGEAGRQARIQLKSADMVKVQMKSQS